jgi:hypothetical protein
MLTKWFLTKFFVDDDGLERPVCTAYGMRYMVPVHPPNDGWALCLMLTAPHQMDAASKDPRVQPYRSSFSTITPETVEAYAAQGAVAGMWLGELLDTLSIYDPNYMTTQLM